MYTDGSLKHPMERSYRRCGCGISGGSGGAWDVSQGSRSCPQLLGPLSQCTMNGKTSREDPAPEALEPLPRDTSPSASTTYGAAESTLLADLPVKL
eukprot:2311672-Amphidinium_carterae.2